MDQRPAEALRQHRIAKRLLIGAEFALEGFHFQKQNAPIVPLNLDAWNSRLYYLFCNLSDELRDITLFHELLNKKGAKVRMTFGQLIDPASLQGDTNELTEQLKQHVAYELLGNPQAVFRP